jgi:hypothetical protein
MDKLLSRITRFITIPDFHLEIMAVYPTSYENQPVKWDLIFRNWTSKKLILKQNLTFQQSLLNSKTWNQCYHLLMMLLYKVYLKENILLK